MSKHTKGPWTTSVGTRGARIHVANDSNHPLSFGFNWDEYDLDLTAEAQANAHLITAAPDYYEACQGNDPAVSALQWLSGVLSDTEVLLRGEPCEDPQALHYAVARSRDLLERLTAAATKAEGCKSKCVHSFRPVFVDGEFMGQQCRHCGAYDER